MLALGDGYTQGESVRVLESWPFQLHELLNSEKPLFQEPKVIAKTGWKSEQLLRQLSSSSTKKFDLVFLMIGMNDQYQQVDIEDFERNFKQLVNESLEKSAKENQTLYVLSIPDYSYSPKGYGNKKKVQSEISKMNQLIKDYCQNEDIPFIDLNPIYEKTLKNPHYLASNKIHPSAAMYKLWAMEIYEHIKEEI